MATSFTISEIFNSVPERMYCAWLDGQEHTSMTGGEANCGNKVGDKFSAWDGYISGKNIVLEESKKIVQKWRTTEFKDKDADSTLEITFEATDGGCKVNIHHSEIPDGQPDYKKGWEDFYFTPMRAYFN